MAIKQPKCNKKIGKLHAASAEWHRWVEDAITAAYRRKKLLQLYRKRVNSVSPVRPQTRR